eukprot:NODE_1083_length_689_cov_7759.882812_g540_i1.p1 GENE.NODE_1083_length_689_cov_7759.882812_g540_i1~~NODE_1083_length_689_cov_7759.882812_g540_i1.p1  ORF type:complete len:212 (-),score=39.38 NODE_1083_length_689_cov_7759.882812_g540_i1:53-655(-)
MGYTKNLKDITMKHELINLPYSYDALEPLMSKETLEFHHDKHHQTYVTKLNELIVGTKYETMTLEEIINSADGAIFNNAAQVYNHDIFFLGLTNKGTKLSQELSDLITASFDSVEQFKAEFITKATTHFGSGWVWLVIDEKGTLSIEATSNAQTPLANGNYPLMVVDVWEHAYYIDYRNVRPKYLENWWQLINWDYVNNV